ncbi:MAG: carbon-nitrogen hydrolase family protein [Solirubrobacterales bacterium]
MRMLRAGICQMNVVNDKKANLQTAVALVRRAAEKGARLAVLPEMFNCPYASEQFPEYAEPLETGPTVSFLSALAKSTSIYLAGGSIPERDAEGHIYNTATFFAPDGRLIARHRKMHLFDVDIPGGITFRESETLTAGSQVTTAQTDFGTIGLAICYDLRFPELARLMVLNGASLLIYPGAFNTTTGPKHWHLLLRARAVDNQAFVLAASPAFHEAGGYPAYGHSLVVDPWGAIIAEAENSETLLMADLDLDLIDQARAQIPVLQHRRTDCYLLKEIE